VLKRGQAVVHRGRRTLRFLSPGDFFGEDALITGGFRNANVTLLEDGVVMVLPQAAFQQLLVATVVRILRQADRGVLLNVGAAPRAGSLHLPIGEFRGALHRLDLQQDYYLVGGSLPERSLAAFLLAQQGAEAWVVLPAGAAETARR
jgi:CRP-like cAMP-binding protein